MSAQINKLKLHPSGQRLLTVAVARPSGISLSLRRCQRTESRIFINWF